METIEAWADSIWRRGIRPETELTISEWADRYRILPEKTSAEPGPWSTERTPYLGEIMDVLSPKSPWRRVVFVKGAQIGGTEAGNNWLGYIIHQAPGPAMLVLPTLSLAKRASKGRIDPMIEESPVLRKLVMPARSRDSGNTVLSKDFPGGVLVIAGANAEADLRSMPVRYLFMDEVDAYPQSAEDAGDPVGLAIKRTVTYQSRSKIFMVSTPLVTGMSRIEDAYEESDQRRYFVPCPHCQHMQVLEWKRVKWTDYGIPAHQAVYECEACQKPIENHQKSYMLPRGEWRSSAEGDGQTAGFHLNSLYSPPGWESWGDLAVKFAAAQRDPERLRVFVNTSLGQSFAEAEDAPEWKMLYLRREPYQRGRVPRGGLVLTAGVDVQSNRIEVEIVAWGRGRESWSVDFHILDGTPTQPDVWRKLTAILNRPLEHECGGVLHVSRLAIDTGHATTHVYDWVCRQDQGQVMAIKGQDRTDYAVGTPSYVQVNQAGRKFRRGARLWPVGVSLLKSQLYAWLRQQPPSEDEPTPEGWCHWPEYSEEYFKQLTAERKVRRTKRNSKSHYEWEPTRDRNEALDCRVYAMAAHVAAGIDRWTEVEWMEAEELAGVNRPEEAPEAQEAGDASVYRSKWMRR